MIVAMVACASPLDPADPTPPADDVPVEDITWTMTLVDESNAPLSGLEVDVYEPGGAASSFFTTNDQGQIAIDKPRSGVHAVEIEDIDGIYASALFAAVLDPAADPRIVLPLREPPAPLPDSIPAEVTIGEGLTVVASARDLVPPPFEAPTSALGATRMTEVLPFPVEHGEVLDVWLLDPYQYEARDGIELRFANLAGHAAGTALAVWQPVRDGPGWQPLGQLEAAGGQLVGDVRLTRTAPLVLVRPTPR